MEVSFIEPRRIISVNDIIGCDLSGNLLDTSRKITNENPCGIGRSYNCFTRNCEYSPWFIFIAIGLPVLAVVVFVIGISSFLRFTKEKNRSRYT